MDPSPDSAPADSPVTISTGLTKSEYIAVHLFEAVTATLSQNCSLQDKAEHAVNAADALIQALEKKTG